ncbi:MFS transporter [Hespellia stercorisuis]|uniref:Probable glucitol transport protein GutA n=1 Tax=Hespellia stercorisuis DSM 15480 TaxID=1121950 RepID=A0A1M6IZK2_9FIRM|nr:MFS transporter [Hespellia stercorisuis]SHJ39817.1 probable glucitol transport protein GutA [Hespellia stercorisuis DSM 15480]
MGNEKDCKEVPTENFSKKYDRKLPFFTKCGFGVANIGDTIITEFVGAFLLFFFTNVAGLRPALGGLVVSLGILWDAVSDPIIGTMSDRCTSKHGRRRPFIMLSVIPIIISSVLLFTNVNLPMTGKFIYYVITIIFYWTSYTMFNIPYLSLGSELTTNNDEKTSASSIRQVFGTCGLLFSSTLPMILVSAYEKFGMTTNHAWSCAAGTLGFMAALAIFITWYSTRGWEIPFPPQSKSDPILKNLGKVLVYKPYIILIVGSLIFYCAFNTITSTVVYHATIVLGVDEAASSIVFLSGTIFGIILSILVGKLAIRFDKKWVFVVFMFISGTTLLVFRVVGIHSLVAQCIEYSLAHFAIIGFLVLSYNLLYDTCETYEFRSGKMLTGVMVSYFSFFVKLGKAAAIQIVGIILEIAGYQAGQTVQSENVVVAVKNLVTLFPGILLIVCGLIICIFPITKKRFLAMQEAKELRKEGKEYSTDAFQKIL